MCVYVCVSLDKTTESALCAALLQNAGPRRVQNESSFYMQFVREAVQLFINKTNVSVCVSVCVYMWMCFSPLCLRLRVLFDAAFAVDLGVLRPHTLVFRAVGGARAVVAVVVLLFCVKV